MSHKKGFNPFIEEIIKKQEKLVNIMHKSIMDETFNIKLTKSRKK